MRVPATAKPFLLDGHKVVTFVAITGKKDNRSGTLEETTYFCNLYKTKFGLVGKCFSDQSIRIMVRGTDHPPGTADTEGALSLDY